MTQEDKSLLIRDLCTRLPYGTMIQVSDWAVVDTELKFGHIERLRYEDLKLKPYLRPMSSMTEEELKIYHSFCYEDEKEILECGEWIDKVYYYDTVESIDYLNSIHVDYRFLIEKGLALEAPEDMYN